MPRWDADAINEVDDRRVAYDYLDDKHISTVRLSIDHGFNGVPLWYETMIFPDREDGCLNEIYCERYTYKEQAEEGHKKAIQWVENGAKDE